MIPELRRPATVIDTLLGEVRRHPQKSSLEVGDFQRVDTPDVEPDAKLVLDGFHMPEEVLVTSSQNTDHAEVRRLEKRDQIFANVEPLCLNVICDDDVVDAHCPTHTAYVASGEIGDHRPVIGIGHRTQVQLLNSEM